MKLKIYLAIFVGILISLTYASALGLTPAKREIQFSTEEQEFVYTIINNEHKDLDLDLYAIGEIADFIEFENPKLHILANELTKDFKIKVKPPAYLKPGKNTGKIVVEEYIPEISVGNTTVYAKIRVISRLIIDVPYPEKYVGVSIDVNKTPSGELNLIAKVKNLGQEDIEKVKAYFGIYEQDKKLEDLESNEESLPKGDIKDLIVTLNTSNLQNGLYTAKATIVYDQYEVELGRDFKVGDIYIEILDYTKYFAQGVVNRFDIDVENKWNRKIKNAYGTIDIENVASLKTLTYDLDPRERRTITTYWDTSNAMIGKYNANITLYYVNKTTSKQAELNVISKEAYERMFSKLPVWLIAMIGVVIVLINVILFLLIYKKKSKSSL